MRSREVKDRAKAVLLKPARFFNSEFAYVARLEMGFSRGALNLATRHLDELRPPTWEFSAFSQNGEDGIIDHLLSLVDVPNRYFIEIGASDGLENNTSYLAFAKKHSGVMVEGNAVKSQRAHRFLESFNWSVKYLSMFVEPGDALELLRECLYEDPDFFSLDIDGNDFFVMDALLRAGLRPKVVCVEYNSAFGPRDNVSIQYTPRLDYLTHHPSQLYYGVSVSGWRTLFACYGYQFVTVDTRGVNAFFVDPKLVRLPSDLKPLDFAENTTQMRRHGAGWETQLAKMTDLNFCEISA